MSNENNKGFLGSIFSKGPKHEDPDLNIPVTGGAGIMSYDPNILQSIQSEDQYIMPEGAGHRRGRFEKAFAQIGGSCMLGAAIGGANGMYTGLKETKELTGSVRQSQMLNYVGKQGAATAQTLGVIALMYSTFGVLLQLARGTDDEINTVTAGTATGALFKSSAGLKGCARGGIVGFSIAALYCLFTSQRQKDRDF